MREMLPSKRGKIPGYADNNPFDDYLGDLKPYISRLNVSGKLAKSVEHKDSAFAGSDGEVCRGICKK